VKPTNTASRFPSREWVENYARMMRDMAGGATLKAARAEFLDAALEAKAT
jgi:hypothetical protein